MLAAAVVVVCWPDQRMCPHSRTPLPSAQEALSRQHHSQQEIPAAIPVLEL
jgi:hypothetical protein